MKFRTSVTGLMIATSLIAVDLASLQAMFSNGSGLSAVGYMVGLCRLTMANVLAVPIYRLALTEGGRRSAFLIGFIASALFALLAFEAFWACFKIPIRLGLSNVILKVIRPVAPAGSIYEELAFFSLSTAVLTLPQFALAFGGGTLLQRWADQQTERDFEGAAGMSTAAVRNLEQWRRRSLITRKAGILAGLALAGLMLIPRWPVSWHKIEDSALQRRIGSRLLADATTAEGRSSARRVVDDAAQRKRYYVLAMFFPWLPIAPDPQVAGESGSRAPKKPQFARSLGSGR